MKEGVQRAAAQMIDAEEPCSEARGDSRLANAEREKLREALRERVIGDVSPDAP